MPKKENNEGNCEYCGKPIKFWFNVKLCNKCLNKMNKGEILNEK